MRNQTIKRKITFWYTGIIVIALGIALGASFFIAEKFSFDDLQTELLDEVGDMEEDIKKYPDNFLDAEQMSYYDDGVMMSIYDERGEQLGGVTPDDFPVDQPFEKEDIVHEVENMGSYWFVYDKRVEPEEGVVYWVRGVHSYSSVALMVESLARLTLILFPILIFLTAFIGHRMISRALKPVSEMTQTVNAITDSTDLSLRLPATDSKDELAELSRTFNNMLEHLEERFLHEKQFTSDAAHEFRTPVSVILSHCEYALENEELNEKDRKEVQIVYEKAQYLSDLVDALLMISRTEKKGYKLNKDVMDLSILAESVVEEMEEDAAEKNIELKLTVHMSEPEFYGDMTMLVQLFSNLISNGIKYGRENGYLHILLREEKGLVNLQFEDNGIGIPKDRLDKIWERFYQVDASRESKGFGLGLFMVKRIVELHKGSIEVSSTEGKGTVFNVTLPRMSESS